VPLSKAASRIMLGTSIAQLRAEGVLPPDGDGGTLPAHAPMSVKEAVLPFARFRTAEGQNVDALLGPEMKSTGEVMGIDIDFGRAFAKSQLAAYGGLPDSGTVFVSVANRDKRAMLFPVRGLVDLGFTILATAGTADVLRRNGIPVEVVRKITERAGEPSVVEDGRTIADRILDGEVAMVVNTPTGSNARADGYAIRAAAITADVTLITTVQELAAAVQGIASMRMAALQVTSLQRHAIALDLYARNGKPSAKQSAVVAG